LVSTRERVLTTPSAFEVYFHAELRVRPVLPAHVRLHPRPACQTEIEMWAPPKPSAPDCPMDAAPLERRSEPSHASIGQYRLGRGRLLGEPDCQAATLAQAGIVVVPIDDLALLPGDMAAANMVQLEGQDGVPGQIRACLLRQAGSARHRVGPCNNPACEPNLDTVGEFDVRYLFTEDRLRQAGPTPRIRRPFTLIE
jgi:hypothetical protein